MEELQPVKGPAGLFPETGEDVNSGAMESLDLCLKLSQDCLEAMQKMPSPNFNEEQCGYLVDKLEVVVQVARSFLELSHSEHCGPDSSWNDTKWVGIFKLLLALGKQVEDFIAGCSRAAWVEAAMTLTNAEAYVSSLGFNLELCKALLSEGECAAMQSGLTLVEVDTLNKAEVEMVKLKAIVDKEYLLRKVTLALGASDLAKYLLRRLVSVHPNPTCDEVNILGNLFAWVVSGRHEEQLGRGASASVYKVMWLGTPVAKKTFFGPENPFFLKEVEVLSQLCHPNITSMFCSTMNKRSCSIIMELMDCDLFALIQRRCGEHSDSPPFFISEAVDLMLQIGEGVNYLHSKGIIHRDLKSMNILVKMVKVAELETRYVQAKVVDFGLSKTKERSATFSHMTYNQGTFRWMAPELVKLGVDLPECLVRSGEFPKYKFKCDVYSFAMVCYEILTGDLPFKDESDRRKIKQLVLEGERPKLPNDCPAFLKALIEECWIGNAKERPTFATICSALKYLKYLLMRGDSISEGTEAIVDHTVSEGSGCLAEVVNIMCLSTLKVDVPSSSLTRSKECNVLPTLISPIAAPSGWVASWARFFSKDHFEAWFPHRRRDFYTYEAFQAATSAFPTFGTSGSPDDQKREIAAFFAHVEYKSRGLRVAVGLNMSDPSSQGLTLLYQGAPAQTYFSRGPMGLSMDFNYWECGQDLGLDLFTNPDQVAVNAVTAWKTALWVWMKWDCHDAILGPPPDFARTLSILYHWEFKRIVRNGMWMRTYTNFCEDLGVYSGLGVTNTWVSLAKDSHSNGRGTMQGPRNMLLTYK